MPGKPKTVQKDAIQIPASKKFLFSDEQLEEMVRNYLGSDVTENDVLRFNTNEFNDDGVYPFVVTIC